MESVSGEGEERRKKYFTGDEEQAVEGYVGNDKVVKEEDPFWQRNRSTSTRMKMQMVSLGTRGIKQMGLCGWVVI